MWFCKKRVVSGPVLVRHPGIEDSELLRRFENAESLPLFGGVMELIRRVEYDLTERAARSAEAKPDEAARIMCGINALRTLEADIHAWKAAAEVSK